MRRKWCLLRLSRIETPYPAFVSNHFVSKIETIEHLGFLSEDTVYKIAKALSIDEAKEIRIDFSKITLIPPKNINRNDRKLLEEAIKTMDYTTILIVRPCKEGK